MNNKFIKALKSQYNKHNNKLTRKNSSRRSQNRLLNSTPSPLLKDQKYSNSPLEWIADRIGATSSSFGANHLSKLWSKLWVARVPPKVKIYVWRIVLARRHLEVEVDYVLCDALGESTLHLLRDCPFSICPWLASPLGPRPKLVFDGGLGPVLNFIPPAR